jgi:hypothetical protein
LRPFDFISFWLSGGGFDSSRIERQSTAWNIGCRPERMSSPEETG